MSVLIATDKHITYLVWAAIDYNRDCRWIRFGDVEVGYENADEVGKALIAENLRSYGAWYSHREEGQRATEEAERAIPYTFPAFPGANGMPKLDPVMVLKALDFYEYQSGDHYENRGEWRASKAGEFCERLRSMAIGKLSGYSAAPWGIG